MTGWRLLLLRTRSLGFAWDDSLIIYLVESAFGGLFFAGSSALLGMTLSELFLWVPPLRFASVGMTGGVFFGLVPLRCISGLGITVWG